MKEFNIMLKYRFINYDVVQYSNACQALLQVYIYLVCVGNYSIGLKISQINF